LYLGQASAIAAWLDETANSQPEVADDLRKQATYFRNSHRRMRYLDYREDLWPIGSGMVESGCKQFQMRHKGPSTSRQKYIHIRFVKGGQHKST
jgi:hypothetical protein